MEVSLKVVVEMEEKKEEERERNSDSDFHGLVQAGTGSLEDRRGVLAHLVRHLCHGAVDELALVVRG